MLSLESPLILKNDSEKINTSLKFTKVDSEELYLSNLKKLGKNWHYNNKEIIYKFNSLGYRSEELDYYTDKEFILVLGCSHTSGIGLPENEIWHSHIKEKLRLDILNGALEGAGPDIILLNSLLFLKNSNLKPKMVLIQWPDLHRFTFKGDDNYITLLPGLFSCPHSDPVTIKLYNEIVKTFFPDNMKKFYYEWIQKNNSVNNSIIFIEITRLLWKLYGVQSYYDFSLDDDKNILIDNYKSMMIDLARDRIHYGHISHKNLSIEILQKLSCNLMI